MPINDPKSLSGKASGWNPDGPDIQDDPLLDALQLIARYHGHNPERTALLAGLPLEGQRLTPSLLARCAQRAGLHARTVRQPLTQLNPRLLPALLILKDERACVLYAKRHDGGVKVAFPEAGGAVCELETEELERLYTGLVCFIQPQAQRQAADLPNRPRGHWFWSSVQEHWRVYWDTLLAALMINLFALALPLFSMAVYDRVLPNLAFDTLWMLALGVVLILGFDFGLRTVRAYIIDGVARRMDLEISARLMEKTLGLRLDALPGQIGLLNARLQGFEQLREFMAAATVAGLVDLPFIGLYLLSLIWISPWLLLPPLAGMLLALLIGAVAKRRMQPMAEQQYQAQLQRAAQLHESLNALPSLKQLGAEGQVQRLWERSTLFIAQQAARLRLIGAGTGNAVFALQQLVCVLVIILGVYELADNRMSLGAIVAATLLAGRAMAPFSQLAALIQPYLQARQTLAQLEHHMQQPSERIEGSPYFQRDRLQGQIDLRDLSFLYPGQIQTTLHGLNLHIKPGERIALLGPGGSGKTTLMKLLLGLNTPSAGSIALDGVDSRQIDPQFLRRNLAYAGQEPQLFHASLRDNLMMGAPWADDASLLTAAEIAGVRQFSDLHPEGYGMQLGERGERLSTSQRQSVGLARALIKDAPVILLDDATSALDPASEQHLAQGLQQILGTKTLIINSHSPALLALVDRVILMDRGRIIGDGPKHEILAALQRDGLAREE